METSVNRVLLLGGPPAVHPRGWRSGVLRKQEDDKSLELIKGFSSMKLLSPSLKLLWQAEEFRSLPPFKFLWRRHLVQFGKRGKNTFTPSVYVGMTRHKCVCVVFEESERRWGGDLNEHTKSCLE